MAERDHWSGYNQEHIFDDERRTRGVARYELRPSARADDDDRSPVFLSPDYDEQEPIEEFTPLRKRRSSISSLILMASCAAAAVAVLFALVSSDALRDVVDIRASVAGVLSTPPATTQTKTAQTDPEPVVSKNPDRWSAPSGATSSVPSITVANAAPAREETKNLDQGQPLARPLIVAKTDPAEPPAEALRRLGADEIAAALKRADALIASGDVAAARLVLRRAAEDGDPKAALLLAGTYDPAMLARIGVHGIAPDAAAARGWYEKARTFGSTEAAQRLQALANNRK